MRRASLALILGGLLAIPLGACSTTSRRAALPEPWSDSPSGLARIDGASYVVTTGTPASAPGARLGVLDIESRPVAYQELSADWGAFGGPAHDLQAACTIPGRPGEFLATESGYEGERFGRIFRFTIGRDEAGEPTAEILGVLKLPRLYDRIHAMACGEAANGDLILMLGEFGSPGRPAKISWGMLRVTDNSLNFQFRGDFSFAAPVLPDTRDTIDCADLLVGADNSIWVVATIDADPRGPFRSIVYRLGQFDARRHQPMMSLEPLTPRWTLDGFRVKAIAAAPDGGGGLCVLTDDGERGSVWRELGR